MDQPVGRIVKCPRCGKTTAFSSTNPYRPFCSERCRLLDLGAWASEKFAIPGKEVDPSDVNQNPPADSDGSQE